MFRRFELKSFEMGLLFRRGEFSGLLRPGVHHFVDPLNRVRVDIVSQRDPWLTHEHLDLIIKSGALKDDAVVVELNDYQRGLVWIENRFSHILPAGQYAYWTGQKDVRVEIVDARTTRFEHQELNVITRSPMANVTLDIHRVGRENAGVLFFDGRYVDTLSPGLYAFWKGHADVRVENVDLRESTIDVSGQDIMTSDKVTLRLNAVVTFQVDDARKAVTQTDGVREALYRETQLMLRGIVGVRELDDFLAEKDTVATEVEESIRRRANELGLIVNSVGIRDVILPGDMKGLMNRVTEAKKEAEANLISRREETAAMRSQANTARLLADNPVLMRLRELEVLEKVAAAGKLNIVLGERAEGEKGLADKVAGLL